MPLRQAQGRLSRQPAGPFDYAQCRLPALLSGFGDLQSRTFSDKEQGPV
jgi:hypothetical protein